MYGTMTLKRSVTTVGTRQTIHKFKSVRDQIHLCGIIVLIKTAASWRFWNGVFSGYKHFKLHVFCKNGSNKDGGGSAETTAPCGSISRLRCGGSSGAPNPDCCLAAGATAPSAGYPHRPAWSTGRIFLKHFNAQKAAQVHQQLSFGTFFKYNIDFK